jgi:hypothetical protein
LPLVFSFLPTLRPSLLSRLFISRGRRRPPPPGRPVPSVDVLCNFLLGNPRLALAVSCYCHTWRSVTDECSLQNPLFIYFG